MLSARGVRQVRSRCVISSRSFSQFRHNVSLKPSASHPTSHSFHVRASARAFSTSRYFLQDDVVPKRSQTPEEVEQVVRDAKQRFRDTLPNGYLNADEYALYERLYGPPLRETAPEDVGIHMHYDLEPKSENEGTLLRQLEGGEFEEVTYELPARDAEEELYESDFADSALLEEQIAEERMAKDQGLEEPDVIEEFVEEEELLEDEITEEDLRAMEEDAVEAGNIFSSQNAGFVDSVARSEREQIALQKLMDDYTVERKLADEAAERARKEAQKKSLKEVLVGEEGLADLQPEGLFEGSLADADFTEHEVLETVERYHPYTLEGKFHPASLEIPLPRNELVTPLNDVLNRSHMDHVRDAAHKGFGGAHMPTAPGVVPGRSGTNMEGLGLAAGHRQMTEIEADAFVATVLPPTYASASSILREVRRRNGSEWIQTKLRDGSGMSVLDAGSGGAALVAWDEIVRAEWDLLKEKRKVDSRARLPGKKTTIIGSDRVRNRVKDFLHDTTFLPRMPDYEHSGEMRGPRLEGGTQQQPRKTYDLIIASHLLLQEKEGHRRQAILNNLWHLLNKEGGVLIILEKAHNRGFEAMAHARDTIINSFLLTPDGQPRILPEDFNSTFHREPEPGRIIAPCTTQGTCPMYTKPGKMIGRKDICYFNQRFVQPTFYSKLLGITKHNQGDVEFSYVAVQRGVFPTSKTPGKEATERAQKGYEHAEQMPSHEDLPRMILPAHKRKGHATLDVCTPAGRIEKWTIPKSYSKLAYHDARKSHWGDLWALGAKTRTDRKVRTGAPADGGKRAQEAEGKRPRNINVDAYDGGALDVRDKRAAFSRKQKHKGRVVDPAAEFLKSEAADRRDMRAKQQVEAEEHDEDEMEINATLEKMHREGRSS